MAQVDFSNAKIDVSTTNPTIYFGYLSLRRGFFDSNGNSVASVTSEVLTSSTNGFLIRYTGTFSASGTEFYFYDSAKSFWRVYNISFSNGDTFDFTIRNNLTCN